MTTFVQYSAHPAVHALGWALVHFLWEGTLVGVLLASVLGLLNRKSAQLRYMAACCALILMIVLPSLTWRQVLAESNRGGSTTNGQVESTSGFGTRTGLTALGEEAKPLLNRVAEAFDHSLPWILLAWFAGVVLLFCRLCFGLIVAQWIKSLAIQFPLGDVREIFHKVSRRLGIEFTIKLLGSAVVEVPTVIGWLRPVVLLPVGCLAGLSTSQIEALLAHELAHIRRHDYLVSVLQGVMETLFFYHPVVWWVSKQIRREREYCCDDLAVKISGDPLAYAKALSFLEERRSAVPIAALGANGGSLVLRIRRLLGCNDAPRISRVFAGALLTITLVATAFTCAATQDSRKVVDAGSTLDAMGYPNLSAKDFADLQHYGITTSFANGMNAIGLGRASVEQLIRLQQYAVDPRYAADIKKVGLDNLSFEDVIRFHQYGVSPEYVAGMYAAGYRKPEQILQLQQEGISVAQVSQLQRAGYRGLSPGEMVSLIHPK